MGYNEIVKCEKCGETMTEFSYQNHDCVNLSEHYQPLFNHMAENHGLTLLITEMQEIIDIVKRMDGK